MLDARTPVRPFFFLFFFFFPPFFPLRLFLNPQVDQSACSTGTDGTLSLCWPKNVTIVLAWINYCPEARCAYVWRASDDWRGKKPGAYNNLELHCSVAFTRVSVNRTHPSSENVRKAKAGTGKRISVNAKSYDDRCVQPVFVDHNRQSRDARRVNKLCQPALYADGVKQRRAATETSLHISTRCRLSRLVRLRK
ncbi:hypothetical protein BCV70DRAFT_91506 [Testicularia cyperi]|uniref:Uncharacterized protein n=1 Tax=Testicularia cyperi TaxID=1882483 RepID=A0A317XSE2_9BASI|nr:hypothetical protein BCV70DRAFT_91506 [Testicularia cyperi]